MTEKQEKSYIQMRRVYKYGRNGVDKRIDTKVIQGTPSIR